MASLAGTSPIHCGKGRQAFPDDCEWCSALNIMRVRSAHSHLAMDAFCELHTIFPLHSPPPLRFTSWFATLTIMIRNNPWLIK